MLKKSALILALALPFTAALHAQTPPAASSPAKKELVARILKLQQPGIEAMARGLIEQPAMELMNGAANAIGARVPKDKQEAMAREIQAELQKFVEETAPAVQKRAVALAPTTIGAMLEDKFSEDELKQIVGIIESPVYGKFQRMGEEMQKSLIEKLVTDTRPTVEPKVRALEQSIGKRLGVSTQSGPAKPAAKPASK